MARHKDNKKMFKKFFVLVLIIAVAIGLFKLGKLGNKTKTEIKVDENKSESKNNNQNVILEYKDQELDDKDKNLKIDVIYPNISGISDQKIQNSINSSIAYNVNNLVNLFKKDIGDPVVGFDDPEITASYSAVNYKNTLSIEMQVSTFVPPSAHPDNFSKTFVYNLQNGVMLTSIYDLCININGCLTKIATKAQEKLKTEITKLGGEFDADSKIGSDAVPENYKNFMLTQDGLKIVYVPYQVAPYVFGTFYITLPWSDLDGIFKEEFL